MTSAASSLSRAGLSHRRLHRRLHSIPSPSHRRLHSIPSVLHHRVSIMMSKDSVRRRLEDSEQGMSYTEFTYQLLQGYDFVHHFRNEGVNVQIGGSDQWGNITAGTDLIRRIVTSPAAAPADAYGLTFPLLLKSDGTKFGKSEDGAIWLSPSMLSPYKFYQHFFTVPDTDVIKFLKRLTFLTMEEIAELERKTLQDPDYVPNTAQKILADEVTRFAHGQQGLDEALKATEALKPGGADSLRLDRATVQGISQDVLSCSFPYTQVVDISVVDLSVSSGLMDSKSAACRLLKQGGLYLNNSRVDNEAKKIETDDIIEGKVLLLSAGKKNKIVEKFLELFCKEAYAGFFQKSFWHLHILYCFSFASVVSKRRRFDFLSDFVPEKVKAGDALAEMSSAET